MSENRINSLVARIYQMRKLKLSHPEGYFDPKGRWFPSPREDAGDGKTVSFPTVKSRYSFRIHCRSKHHVKILVGRALQGLDVPPDVRDAVFPDKAHLHNPDEERLIEPVVMKKDLPELVEEFFAFLKERESGQYQRKFNSEKKEKHGRA